MNNFETNTPLFLRPKGLIAVLLLVGWSATNATVTQRQAPDAFIDVIEVVEKADFWLRDESDIRPLSDELRAELAVAQREQLRRAVDVGYDRLVASLSSAKSNF